MVRVSDGDNHQRAHLAICQIGLNYLKTCLTKAQIFKYPDPSKRYVVFTDVSDQAAAAILTQEYASEDGETKEC